MKFLCLRSFPYFTNESTQLSHINCYFHVNYKLKLTKFQCNCAELYQLPRKHEQPYTCIRAWNNVIGRETARVRASWRHQKLNFHWLFRHVIQYTWINHTQNSLYTKSPNSNLTYTLNSQYLIHISHLYRIISNNIQGRVIFLWVNIYNFSIYFISNYKVEEIMIHLGRGGVRFASSVSATAPDGKAGKLLDAIIRVNHAGELGADRIYAGQMAVLGKTSVGPTIQHMWEQEKIHRAKFEELIQKYRVRPTALLPIWNVAGYLLGAGTAMLGEKAAMACTVAVETVIVEHYNDQLRVLLEDLNKNENNELMETIKKFRDEEQEHHDTGIDYGAEQAPLYQALTNVIKAGCKTAIAISKVV